MQTPKEIDEVKENLIPFFGVYGSKKITELILETSPRKITGRKRLKADKVKNYSFSLHPDTWEKLQEEASIRGVTKSAIIRHLIENHL